MKNQKYNTSFKPITITLIIVIFSFLSIIFYTRNTKHANYFQTGKGTPPEIDIRSRSASPTVNESIYIPTTTTAYSYAKVTKVIDGDTIEINGGITVRYIGINTPETKDPRKKAECFGISAFEKNRELVEGKTVRLEKDVSDKDKYGRLLRYVFLDDLFINEYLVREGYAQVSTFPPDVKFADAFIEAQRLATEENLGL